ncbi:hypothetical protein KP509_23G079300 [Ceratopteris richardii]|nr:hypothetical protein KP509_23G079300 [Ceratopteris richardii]KAH7302606.1 hypothetical protein KP509_23G079300 [Ceratopteris richardii]
MLAWQQPFANSQNEHEKMVREHAFCRIAPAIPGVADRATAHKLYEALTNGEVGLSFSVWNTYISELLRVFEERKHHKIHESSILSLEDDEIVLCVGSSKRQPVQMWNSANIAWPGRLTLTDRSLYFEPNGLFQHQKPMKLNLTGGDGTVEKIKVGPLGAPVLDSAIMVKTDSKSDPWVLEFVDFSGGGRRGLWFAFVNELLLAYRFIAQYGPPAHDPFIYDIQDNQSGTRKVIMSAINGMARVQALQSTLGRLTVYPMKLLQFSHLDDHPSGDIVKQTLAVNIWGIQLVGNQKNPKKLTTDDSIIDAIGSGLHAVDVDRSVYLHRWMRSPTWQSPTSSSFWKQKVGGKALILRKDLVIGDLTHTERAVKAFKEQTQMIERTKATISGALVKGIPSNIDLFKELMLPFTLLSIHLRKLQKWERPRDTLFFLASFLLLLYKGWFKYAMPVIFLTTSVLAFTLHNLKYQGRLADNFGQVVIREQPPSNSLQKMLALKEALEEVEVQIQKVNIAILKLRSLALAGHPQAKNIVALSLLAGGLILVFVPFRYVCTFVLLDQFTCELDFRRATVLKLARQLHDWWEAIPAAPVVVLPYEEQEGGDRDIKPDDSASPKGEVIAEAIKEWVAESF